jgi:hypothetical protein
MNAAEFFEKVWTDFEASGLKPTNLLTTPHNGLMIASALNRWVAKYDKWPTSIDMLAIIKVQGDIDDPRTNGHGLEYHHNAGDMVGDPSANLPHEDCPALRAIRNMSDVKRTLNLPAEQLRHFAHLKPTSKAFEEYNARIKWIQDHNIQGPDSLGATTEKTDADSAYDKLRERVSRITPKDCGATSTQQGQSAWQKVNRFKRVLNEVLTANQKRGVSAEEVSKYIESEVSKFSDSGVR